MREELLARFQRRAPDVKDELLLTELLEDAENYILGYTGRRELPAALRGAQVQLAAIYLNRLGMEGQSGYAAGGESFTVDALPEDLRRLLNRYRLAGTVKP